MQQNCAWRRWRFVLNAITCHLAALPLHLWSRCRQTSLMTHCHVPCCFTLCLQDTDSVVNSLETGLGMLIHFVFIALYLLVWGVNIVQVSRTLTAYA